MIPNARLLTKFKICTLIRQMLLEDESVQALVGNKIFPIIAPETTTGNYIAYQRDAYIIDRTKTGIVNQSCVVYISCVSPDYDESNEMAEAVFLALDMKYNIKDDNNRTVISEIMMTDSTEDKIGDKYVQTLEFQVR